MIDLQVHIESKPGTLAELAKTLGDAGVNIEGISGFPCSGRGKLHLVVSDVEKARAALQEKGIPIVREREVLVTTIEDIPGALAAVAKKFGDAGIDLNLVYVASNSRLVIGVKDFENDLERAKALL